MAQRSLPKRRRGGVPTPGRTSRQVAVLLTLSMVSGGWTYSLVSTGEESPGGATALPAPSVPQVAPAVAASVSTPARAVPAGQGGVSAARVALASRGVPAPALAAYQRAEQVINQADAGCRLDWSVLAAIGHVESDHGRHGDSVLRSSGISTPGIYGPQLDGGRGTAEIRDTDAGLYDRDEVFDRAVGPMQFIPETWSRVGVDSDGDGRRNPQDIDDAALAAAVYLCSGSDDLSTSAGQIAAIHRYNHSDSYARMVRALAAQYAAGEGSGDAFLVASPVRLSPRSPDPLSGTRRPTPSGGGAGSGVRVVEGTPHTSDGATGGSTDQASTAGPAPASSVPAVPTLDQAAAYCRDQLTGAQLLLLGGVTRCAQAYLEGGLAALTALLPVLGSLANGLRASP